jgi:hypothetical protein
MLSDVEHSNVHQSSEQRAHVLHELTGKVHSFIFGKYFSTLLPYDLNILNFGIFVSWRKAWKRRAELRIAVGAHLRICLPV